MNDAAEAERYFDLAIERHWVSGDTVLAAWHASWNRRTDEAKVRQAGFLSAEVGEDGRIARLRHWTVTREHLAGRKERLMAGEISFDVVSDFDEQELRNALDQVRREVQQRYDFKGAHVDLVQEKTRLVLVTDSDMRARAIRDLIESKAVRRNLSLKIFDWGEVLPAGGNKVRQEITLRRGLPDDLARKLVKLIRDEFPKVQPQSPGRRDPRRRQEQGRAAEGHRATPRARRGRAAPVRELPLRRTRCPERERRAS